MPAQHEPGLVDDDSSLHAVRKKIIGRVALCGAGPITQVIAGRFDPTDDRSCPRCAARLEGAE